MPIYLRVFFDFCPVGCTDPCGGPRPHLSGNIGSIIRGHYAPGDLLPTGDALCRQLGVSRSVVREATKAVTILGMIRSRQGRGTEVLPYENWNDFAPEVIEARSELKTVDEFLVHLLELRRIIEVEAAGLAAERAECRQ